MSFIDELKRRNVIRVAIAYAIAAWILIEITATTFPILKLPDWSVTLVTVFVLIGFPLALIFAWAFELTPEGLKREHEVDRTESITHITGRKLDFIIIAVMALALGYFAYDKFSLQPESGEVFGDMGRSIAVLPFANRSASEADAFFVDGLHDDLLTHISKIGSIKTISRTSVMQYRDTNKTIPQIAEELGVATIMEGGVQRAGDTIRINVQLIDAVTDEHLWAQTYDRQLTAASIFAIQSEIATAIAEELRATLSLDEQQRLATVPTESLPALEAYFLGKQRMATRVTDDLAEAVDLFQRAIELDPDFALAYVGLADTYTLQRMHAGFPPDEMSARSELAINKALELDDRLGEAYASLGLLIKTDCDPESAEMAFKRALALNPSYASAHQWYAVLLSYLGRPKEALAHIKIAVELDPLSALMNANLAWAYLNLGRYDEAMAQFKSNIAIDPEFRGSYGGVGSLYWRVYGQLDKAVPGYEKVVAMDPGNSNGLAWLGLLFLDIGDDEQAEYWIGRSRELAPDGFDTNLAMHILHAYRGEDDQATDYAYRVLNDAPREWYGRVAATYLRDRDSQAGLYPEARARYETAFPELLTVNEPEIDGANYGAAINLAMILSATGEQERADLLLERSLAFIETIQRLGYGGFWVSDVQIYALQGQTAAALAALREAIDEGWRSLWWYYLEHDKNLDSIRHEAEFQAMVEEVRADITAQLVRLREAKASGELTPIPKSFE